MWWKQLKRKENIETANNEVFRCLCIVFHLLNLSPFPFLCDLPVGDSFLTLWKCLERHFPECLLYWWKLEAQVIWKLTVFLRYCSLPIFYMWFQRSLYIYIWTMYALVTTIQNFSYTSKFCDWFFFLCCVKNRGITCLMSDHVHVRVLLQLVWLWHELYSLELKSHMPYQVLHIFHTFLDFCHCFYVSYEVFYF